MRRYEITDQQWQQIAHLLPGKVGHVGRSAVDNRLFINAVIWIARSGAPWRDLPERFGPWNSVYQRFRRWAKAGVWKTVFDELQEPDLDWLMIDSTTVRAHQHAAGPKKSDPASECLGQSVGGWTTKIHAVVDALGNPMRLILSVGQRADITQAKGLLTGYETDAVLADRGYDANELIDWLTESHTQVVIPSKKNRLADRQIDENLYKERNQVERYFNKLKQYRRVATRYEKTAVSFAGFIYLSSALILLA
ncbi:IS5 family transposase [Spirosoma taeanense]|uniref:IS5 family transposase n=1 Tax=Spirosoma taeanense TaxID=2735870 RepID=A0A6M5Y4S7_9BACT|nr:IS5 family transposase [Spirosoma taeanense]QJW88200.1 IS5 family transposase [Spirosoma taeanense]QJW88434.1 IS5 family transposase [Spirosoma taeanense]QJW89876.1 IS5 family transposase [Spirosoma taeanense]